MTRIMRTNNLKACYTYKLMYSLTMYNTAAALGDVALAFPLNFPGQGRNNAGTYAALTTFGGNYNVIAPSAAARLFTAFDEYRVAALKCVFVPYFNNTVSGTTAGNEDPLLMYWLNDIDDIASPTEVAACNMAIVPVPVQGMKRYTHFYKQPRALKERWINTGNVSVLPTAGTTGNTTLPVDAFASVKIFVPRVPSNGYIGRLYLTWEMEFRAINSTS